jgi:hypothetical protein
MKYIKNTTFAINFTLICLFSSCLSLHLKIRNSVSQNLTEVAVNAIIERIAAKNYNCTAYEHDIQTYTNHFLENAKKKNPEIDVVSCTFKCPVNPEEKLVRGKKRTDFQLFVKGFKKLNGNFVKWFEHLTSESTALRPICKTKKQVLESFGKALKKRFEAKLNATINEDPFLNLLIIQQNTKKSCSDYVSLVNERLKKMTYFDKSPIDHTKCLMKCKENNESNLKMERSIKEFNRNNFIYQYNPEPWIAYIACHFMKEEFSTCNTEKFKDPEDDD